MRKFLLATDGSESSLRSAAYLAGLYQDTDDAEVTVLHISPSIPPTYTEEINDPAIRKKFEAWKARKEEEARGYLREAVRVLKDGGFPEKQIKTRSSAQVVGVARDIIREADASLTEKKTSKQILAAAAQGKFGTLILGRKGVTRAREFRLGSVCLRTVSEAENCAVWAV